MSGNNAVRLINDEPALGSWNMSVDQVLLETAAERGEPTFRIYAWEPATLSLGYFQDFASRNSHPPSQDCPVVRRASGGGAILHDAEITYSVALPWTRDSHASNRNLFDQVHRSLVTCLAHFGITGCEIYEPAKGEVANTSEPVRKPFLCFLRRSPGDVILGADKVIGSAQRRGKGALLQHGSILFRRSEYAPELPGLLDAGVAIFAMEEFGGLWPQRLGKDMGWRLLPGRLSEQEIANANRIERQTFGNESWTGKR
ncbi:MAG: lipoate--protein ligase family protein [Pirellulaceae bacterium]